MCQLGKCPPPPLLAPGAGYISLMNETTSMPIASAFFRALHTAEDARAVSLGLEAEEMICQDPDYMEGYDYVMDIVKDAILEGYEVRDLADLDNFVNQVDAYAGDYEGGYGEGYQAAANLCLEVVSQLLNDSEV